MWLELFLSVRQAVRHAHQKGIIHHDIKPSNVLVAMQDGRPEVKIIDFGVAKAIAQRLTEQTLQTGFSQMLVTPLYMSPEQASPLRNGRRTGAGCRAVFGGRTGSGPPAVGRVPDREILQAEITKSRYGCCRKP